MTKMSENNRYLALGNKALREGRFDEAIGFYEKCICEYPELAGLAQKNKFLVQKKKERTHNFLFNIDRIDGTGISGWIYDVLSIEKSLSLDFYIDDRKVCTLTANIERKDLISNGHPISNCGFFFNYMKYLGQAQFCIITAKISDTNILAFPNPIVIEPLSAKISALTDLAKVVRNLVEKSFDRRHDWLLIDLFPKMIEDARKSLGKSLSASFTGVRPISGKTMLGKVDVIIPVFEGFEETKGCIYSVLAAKNKVPHRLIVINDKSPNDRMTDWLRSHTNNSSYLLLENEENLGFVGTVNRGMMLHDNTDVVLLNSDTLVPDGWLDQIVSAAYSAPEIGTVTPFSNNATICSYPDFCQDNSLPLGMNVNELNHLFHKVNSGQIIDIPTAHGFCMFIKRATLKEVGIFDDEKWGKGYGEENDFSLRAEQRGWRNVIALDTFVQHLGSVSFAENADQFIKQNLEKLNGLYPDYAESITSFIYKDPIRPFRNRVALVQLKNESLMAKAQTPAKGKAILFVSLTLGGGTQVATDDLANRLKEEGQCVLMLTSPKKGVWKISSHVTNIHVDYAWPDEKTQLIRALKLLGVWHVHYHHTIEFPKDIWELPKELNLEYDVTIHDYFTICPRVNLVDGSRRYCGEPLVSACNQCIKINGVHQGVRFGLEEFGHNVEEWKAFHGNVLLSARKVFTPSKDTADRILFHFENIKLTVRPHPEEIVTVTPKIITEDEVINVAFIGAIGIHKGYDYLVGCAQEAQKSMLPIHFHVLGYTMDDERLKQFDNVTVHGRYNRKELSDIIEKTGCQVAALLSVWPETYSYTLSEALKEGIRILHFGLGAFEERLVKKQSLKAPLNASFSEICQIILKFRGSNISHNFSIGYIYESILKDFYEFVEVDEFFNTGVKNF